jgi:hypothetical protein
MEYCINLLRILRPKNNTPLNNIAHHMEAKKWNIYLTIKVKFSPRIYIIDSVKFAKVFKLAIRSNSKNFFTQLYSINY